MHQHTRVEVEGKRIFRQIALPFPVFEHLKALQRQWGYETNAEVITRCLLAAPITEGR